MNSDFGCIFDFFHEVRADFRDFVIDDVDVKSSDDFKELQITLKYPRLSGGYGTTKYTYTNKETYWGDMYEYIRVVKLFMNEYNKYSDNGTAEPKTKFSALRYAYNRRVHRCGETW
jgi:hypothetical protein